NERYRPRPLVAGDTVLAPFHDFFGGGCFTVARNDDGVNAFAPFFICDTDAGDILDLWMAADQRLHFGRINILAAGDDHVALAVDEMNVALLVAAGRAVHES